MEVTYADVVQFRRVSNPAKRPDDGYGNKIPTDWQVMLRFESKWHKVYAICHSNVASHYILVNTERLFVRDSAFPETH
jgi:hypothetical protein